VPHHPIHQGHQAAPGINLIAAAAGEIAVKHTEIGPFAHFDRAGHRFKTQLPSTGDRVGLQSAFKG
jgi:hypothetical protein